ncbi:MAG: BolA family transcriptional regulator [Gammaproteobacteria bacterium]|nr:BolA family transcriptional regulator [Gammaproteobacteria bacterium]
MQTDKIKQLIESSLTNASVFVEGDGAHFTATVVSAAFADKSRIAKQQMVYDAVRTEILDGTLHALSIKTYTPEEWEQLNRNS